MKDDLFKNNIGIIGAGHIGQALALSLLEKKYPRENIQLSYNGSIFTFSDLYDNNLDELIHNNSDIVKSCSIIILSVPPQNFRQIGEFGLDEDVLVISFMAGISIDTIKRQTGSNNVVRIIPTGPGTIRNYNAIAGVYPENKKVNTIFKLLEIDYYVLDNENQMKYMVLAGCLPAVYSVVDAQLDENKEAIGKIAEEFSDFIEISSKAEKLVPKSNKEEFVKEVSTPGGVTEAIINSLSEGKSLYDSLIKGLERNEELS